ncbi:MAG: hypothetical protein NTW86_31030 [Candidatus Sumerlaeota bacterium]|nr:hypothetical protein [Candidatus Sumerlaeota bacterium]
MNRVLLKSIAPIFGFAVCLSVAGAAPASLIVNGGFERSENGGAAGWEDLWTREPNAARLVFDTETRHGGARSARIEHTGAKDWSLNAAATISVKPGDVFALEGWIRIQGAGTATLCVETIDAKGKAVSWTFGNCEIEGEKDWTAARSRFVIPPGVVSMLPRVIGTGAATVWVDDLSLVKEGNTQTMRNKDLPAELKIQNAALTVALRTADATLAVTDRRAGQTWTQKPGAFQAVLLNAAVAANGKRIELGWLDPASGLNMQGGIELDGDRPEFTFSLSAEGKLAKPLAFPQPFVTDPGTYLVIPMNEGISYPVEDESIQPMRLIAYGGHGICMAFWGATDGERGQMAILETPDDAAIRIARQDGRLCVAPEWDARKGQFGYERRLRYVFFDQGGHVAMCKRYREYAKQIGLFKTLEEKRRVNPNVDLLVGAVNTWYWAPDAAAMVREMKAAGIERILWSHAGQPEDIQAMNDMGGVLTSRYDIYQDLMDPHVIQEKLGRAHPDWTQGAWPKDIMIGANGEWTKGWQVKGKDGVMYPCAVCCDRQAVGYARERVPADLATHPYRCRFIDTTTAAPWRECYSPDHPMTRSDSRHWKMELLRYMSEEMKLVTGSETGHDASVPFVHYYEGMMSLASYRVPDAGRAMQKILDEAPERVVKFQLGWQYRLPLWELVYHDCVVAQWYWGDYNNKIPSLWDKRDLFNILYASGPMFMFNREFWEKNKERFARSYRNISPVARAAGYAEMTDHRFLALDRSVQQTRFANGVVATVNFGDQPFRLPDGAEVAALGFHVEGVKAP